MLSRPHGGSDVGPGQSRRSCHSVTSGESSTPNPMLRLSPTPIVLTFYPNRATEAIGHYHLVRLVGLVPLREEAWVLCAATCGVGHPAFGAGKEGGFKGADGSVGVLAFSTDTGTSGPGSWEGCSTGWVVVCWVGDGVPGSEEESADTTAEEAFGTASSRAASAASSAAASAAASAAGSTSTGFGRKSFSTATRWSIVKGLISLAGSGVVIRSYSVLGMGRGLAS